MMQISSIPAQSLNLFQGKNASFKCRGSPLNPLTRLPSANSRIFNSAICTESSTRNHLSNLDKLLQKQAQPNPPGPQRGPLENKGKGGLEGLNLARIWPEMKAAEEMSPRNLNRLQRLLSRSDYSPRNNLGGRWRDYHGARDWAGLLDPLDENLRREVVRYGEFVQAAYHCFHSDPRHVSKRGPDSPSRGVAGWVLPGYKESTSCIGYVAVCDDQREIARMGRRDIVIALRGTSTCLEWAENMRDLLVHMPSTNNSTHRQPKVECGFLSLYKTCGARVPSLSESLLEEIRRLMDQYKGETLSITVTGHSLGAALALLVADELSMCAADVPPVAVFSFGGPRVGNRGFADRINSKNVKVLRIVNSQDVITRVPGMFVSEGLDRTLRNSSAATVLDVLDNNMPWAYSHVGTELRIDTKMSPYLKPNADVACCHDLEAYLHLVDGFLSSNSPFREDAKRSLVKLLHEQNSNVKKLYTSKVKALSLNVDKREGIMGTMPSCLPSPSN
ncbi:alpha/beta-Hydrolases superfamily protein [Actinidia rufa]|uniref:Alpha/beta-Hydrolases superfamily protein n=1 Tax=Actinidia rufa TaxID=165716 RepID=A0A7J0FTQ2_9ERIC|nr:alpha/beta-Hydrolases superfamily protein [Actinidia rufa]